MSPRSDRSRCRRRSVVRRRWRCRGNWLVRRKSGCRCRYWSPDKSDWRCTCSGHCMWPQSRKWADRLRKWWCHRRLACPDRSDCWRKSPRPRRCDILRRCRCPDKTDSRRKWSRCYRSRSPCMSGCRRRWRRSTPGRSHSPGRWPSRDNWLCPGMSRPWPRTMRCRRRMARCCRWCCPDRWDGRHRWRRWHHTRANHRRSGRLDRMYSTRSR